MRRMLRRSPGGAVAVAASAHDCGPERSLRTALGGPPRRHLRPGLRPSLQIPSGASRLLATTAPAPPGYEVLGLLRYKSCGQGMKSAGTPIAAARAAAIGICHWVIGGVSAFANAAGGVLMTPPLGGRGGDGRRAMAGRLLLQILSRAAHPAVGSN
ncbi:hypothetical protein D3C87_1372590 [compost metagenome]